MTNFKTMIPRQRQKKNCSDYLVAFSQLLRGYEEPETDLYQNENLLP